MELKRDESNEFAKKDSPINEKFWQLKTSVMYHRMAVQVYMQQIARDLMIRGRRHDASSIIDETELSLASKSVILTDETETNKTLAKKYLDSNDALLKAHANNNDHHPEHFETGIMGMDLIQFTEMLCDTMARADELGIAYSDMIDQLCEQYSLSSELYHIVANTVNTMTGDKHHGAV